MYRPALSSDILSRRGREPAVQREVEAEMAASVAAKAEEIVAARMQSEEVQKTVEQRLREERARLEQKVFLPLLLPTHIGFLGCA